ncbi:signal recognition particle protein [Wallemia mellicola CBS 633.66]|uniref:Signal recognition particle 54 kDa protein n=2 Tax=Wallemia mellicola TaxID=1708541 RepID=A0A4T0RYR0_9BASI|nr:signal recognition particle protein [Wallemia mellicola CBS 633.66]TIB70628.1 hypothetical protein E3Q23_04111 [Wallemia mellicola]EIM21564.1 signal recognition particle protein [Wallemia mellicola CBS 633.66]TIB74438.1 hypothetical protein E3Q24_00504 [Wallemia mellicola]TIB85183.1 signal recognition particle protein [Wallemia mellicola]TIB89927.1 signal recognition particle protein [Wallemia mellicola]|eukprot:XP_006958263.1 signal recognition particle protein [Wallemia mellicola CBS 633.66]
MVLAGLGRQLNSALNSFNKSQVIDEKTLDGLLKEISKALLESDINVKLVGNLRNRVKTRALKEFKDTNASGNQQKQIVQKAIFDELVALVDPQEEPYKPTKGKTNIIMAVGLQGAGKTTSCTKLAVHYQRKGFKVGLVCADTFRAGAFDQLKQNATKAKIPFYGSYTETDPVVISEAGVQQFKKSKFDVIIVDTSGRHKQEEDLFEEMRMISQAVKPHMTVLVMDGAMGQAAESQASAFKESSDFGAIIVTKMDGHAKGGGAISAVAATKTPIIFIGTGENLHDIDTFRPRPFVQQLLGMGDMQGLLEHVQDVAMSDPDKQKELAKKFEQGSLSIRDWAEQIKNVTKLGPISKIAGMIPGLNADMIGQGGDDEASKRIKRMLFITDSMTEKELDSNGTIFLRKGKDGKFVGMSRRALRVARGSGTSVREVEELLVQYTMMKSGILNMMKGQAGGMKPGQPGMPSRDQIQQMQKMMPPQLLQKLRSGGGPEILQQLQRGQIPKGMDPEMMEKMAQQMGMNPNAMGGMPQLPGMGAGGAGFNPASMLGGMDFSKMAGMFGGGR